MNKHLTLVSLLLLIFYMGWFILDQQKLIENQKEKIIELQSKIIYHGN
jgi:hypothetical protein